MTADEKERIIALGVAGGLTREEAELTFDAFEGRFNAHFEFERKCRTRSRMEGEIGRVMRAEVAREMEKEKEGGK